MSCCRGCCSCSGTEALLCLCNSAGTSRGAGGTASQGACARTSASRPRRSCRGRSGGADTWAGRRCCASRYRLSCRSSGSGRGVALDSGGRASRAVGGGHATGGARRSCRHSRLLLVFGHGRLRTVGRGRRWALRGRRCSGRAGRGLAQPAGGARSGGGRRRLCSSSSASDRPTSGGSGRRNTLRRSGGYCGLRIGGAISWGRCGCRGGGLSIGGRSVGVLNHFESVVVRHDGATDWRLDREDDSSIRRKISGGSGSALAGCEFRTCQSAAMFQQGTTQKKARAVEMVEMAKLKLHGQ
jgi:hypothetical protein